MPVGSGVFEHVQEWRPFLDTVAIGGLTRQEFSIAGDGSATWFRGCTFAVSLL